MGQPHSAVARVITDVATLGITALIRVFSDKPKEENSTHEAIRAENERRAREEEERRAREEEERRAREERERRAREEHDRRAREERERIEAERRREEEARKKAEEERRRAEEEKRRAEEARERAEESERLVREEAERERARNAELERLRREAEEKERLVREEAERERARNAELERQTREAEEASQRALYEAEEARRKEQEAAERLKRGIRPLVVPTLEEFEAAKVKLNYQPDKLHFAICGASGTGKSTLINSLRGVPASHHSAAPVGTKETTFEIARYPDPTPDPPFSRFVWYDIPGAGTLSVPGWQYFNDYMLYMFDFLILVYGGRFTESDAAVLENAARFDIPTFIVRSRSDTYIRDAYNDAYDDEPDLFDEEDLLRWREVKEKYVQETRENLVENLQLVYNNLSASEQEVVNKEEFLKKRVYIISSRHIRQFIDPGSVKPRRLEVSVKEEFVDEKDLIHDILKAAAERRYEPGKVTATTKRLKEGANEVVNEVVGIIAEKLKAIKTRAG